MPCFPSSKARAVEPEPVTYKNVHRYGETNIRHLDTRPREQWQKGNKYQGRQLPATPTVEVEVEPHHLRQQPDANLSSRTYTETQRRARPQQVGYETPRSMRSQQVVYETPRSDRPPSYRAPAPPREEAQLRQRPPRPKTADFFVSVPIFNETMNHSYRKKNTYVYRDSHRDHDALYHASLARASSVRSLDRTDSSRPHSGQIDSYRKYRGQQRPHSADRYYDERRYDDRYNRSGDRLVQTLPSDLYSKPVKRGERHREVEYRRPRSADRHRSDSSQRNPRRYENSEKEYYRSKARYVEGQDDYYGPVYMKEKPRSHRRSNGKRRQRTRSEFSYDSRASARSYGSVYSYESERLDPAVRLRKAPSSIGISIDSDGEDRR